MEAADHDIAKVLADIGNAMKTGNLSPTPQKDLDPCAYCRYKAVCRSAVPQKNR
jgi:CRISPR/Cas system-associated exonuclease Cas4 (RecB family)